MSPLILIPARMASTRLPDKPLALIEGEPMIVHVWRRAAASAVGEVIVACDGEAIAQAIRMAGGKAIVTDPNLPSGSDRIHAALAHADPQERHDLILNVQGDMPLLDPALVRSVLEPLADPQTDMATLATEIHDESEKIDPAVVKAVIGNINHGIGRALYFTRATAPWGAGPLYHHIGLYAYRRAALKRFVSLPPSPLETREKLEQLRALEAGMRIDIALVDTVPLGVDTPQTLAKARALAKRQTASSDS